MLCLITRLEQHTETIGVVMDADLERIQTEFIIRTFRERMKIYKAQESQST